MNSNEDSKIVTVKQTVLNDCSKALDELSVYDKLLESKEGEIKLLQERLGLEKEKFALVRELADSRANQAASLTEANNSLKDAIAAQNKLIENKDKEIAILKKKKVGLLTVLKAVAAGVAIGLAL